MPLRGSAFLFSFIIAALVVAPTTCRAGDRLDAEDVAARIQEIYETAQGISADFTQVTALRLSRRERQGSGRVVLRKPGLMRWDYHQPDRQVLISDGSTLTMYFEKSQQMIVSPAEEYLRSDVTYGFFTGTGDILRDFDVSFAGGSHFSKESAYLLKLVPKKPHPQVAQLYLWADGPDFVIHRLQIIDHFNTITDLSFSNIAIDTGSDEGAAEADLFTFTPPPDTEIIHQ